MIGKILRKIDRINQSKMCAANLKKNDISTTDSPIGSTSSRLLTTTPLTTTTTPVTLPTGKPKLAQKNMKKICKMIFRAVPKMSLNNMMNFRQFYKPTRKCHWIEINSVKAE